MSLFVHSVKTLLTLDLHNMGANIICLVYLFITSVIVYKLWQTHLIELERGKCIKYHCTEFWGSFVLMYGNSSAFARQWRQFEAIFPLTSKETQLRNPSVDVIIHPVLLVVFHTEAVVSLVEWSCSWAWWASITPTLPILLLRYYYGIVRITTDARPFLYLRARIAQLVKSSDLQSIDRMFKPHW